MCLTEILDKANNFKNKIAHLKRVAPFYPDIHFEGSISGEEYATTMVKFIYNRVEYKRHHVQSYFPMEGVTDEMMLKRLRSDCELTIKYAIPCQFDEVIRTLREPPKTEPQY